MAKTWGEKNNHIFPMTFIHIRQVDIETGVVQLEYLHMIVDCVRSMLQIS